MNTININDYILTDETNANKDSIWLNKLPNDETLFDVIDKLRKVHKEEILVFTEEIKIIGKTIYKRINLRDICTLAKFILVVKLLSIVMFLKKK